MTDRHRDHVACLKTATQAAVRLVGGVEAAASCTRVGKTQISEYQNRNSAHIAPIDVAVALDISAQQPVILAAMASITGFALLPIAFGEGCAATAMGDVAASASETLSAALRALADGRIDRSEAQDLSQRLSHLIRISTDALQKMQALAFRADGEG
ncbi:hypothetical protein [Swaminathania salitolerans]|uniref:Uncharacterized protein n=1 Tax=Swaminathania salitolerans TaxID=182838 RepID=A0A511BNG2_9PROT|nr:hypothetical protein [Swaminathania salitolerans]GBQ14786.1 hypothetical protein AA21291_1955 [Swaminathania salitolerans LMG 21291]GEL01887.1 hypothetical protein SSA02_10500 [Swaminathania salitolerans]